MITFRHCSGFTWAYNARLYFLTYFPGAEVEYINIQTNLFSTRLASGCLSAPSSAAQLLCSLAAALETCWPSEVEPRLDWQSWDQLLFFPPPWQREPCTWNLRLHLPPSLATIFLVCTCTIFLVALDPKSLLKPTPPQLKPGSASSLSPWWKSLLRG